MERRIYRENVLCKRNDGWMGSNGWIFVRLFDEMKRGCVILKDEAWEIEDDIICDDYNIR